MLQAHLMHFLNHSLTSPESPALDRKIKNPMPLLTELGQGPETDSESKIWTLVCPLLLSFLLDDPN